jgi:membrane peptidoglycan carboxypeptidase
VSGQHKPGSGKEPWPWQKPKPAARTKGSAKSSTGGGTRGGNGGGNGPKPSTRKPSTRKPSTGKGPARPPSRLRKWTKRIFLAGFVSTLMLFVLFAIAYARTDIPDPNAAYQTETSYVFYKDGKTILGKFATQDRNSVDLQDMGQYTANAAIAAEDRTFYSNRGIDPKGILRAFFSNVRGNSTQGASTITQQYVKVLYLTQERSYKRKIKEALVSLKLQAQTSKDDILAGYLNTIYFGRGSYGIDAAAHAYFGIPAKQLNLKQSAALAAIINSPNNYNPANGPEAKAALFNRYLYVLGSMRDLETITDGEYSTASARLPRFPRVSGNSGYVGQNGYVLQMVRDQLHKLNYSDAEIDGSGLRITTTIDKTVMEAAQQAVASQRPPGLNQLHIAVASTDPKTGGLRGLYAGAPYEKTKGGRNWALDGGAPGSAFKPFAMAAGLKDGYSLKSTFMGNSPIRIGGLSFKNEGEGFGEQLGSHLDFTRCLAKSVNTCFIDLTEAMSDGSQKVYRMIRQMGIPTKTYNGRNAGLRPEVGVSLGSATVSPIDMANAYATIDDSGVGKKWYLIDSVKNADGATAYKHKLKTNRVIEPDVAADTIYAMQQVVKAGTGTKALALGRPVAGKTGTATDEQGHVRSAWFVGFTPQLSTAVMYVRGNGNGPLDGYMDPFFGGTYPCLTWTDMMSRALEGQPIEDFPPPVFKKATQTNHAPVPTFTPKPPPKKPTKTPSKTKTPSQTPTVIPTTPPPTTPTGVPTVTCTVLEPCPPNQRPSHGPGKNRKIA